MGPTRATTAYAYDSYGRQFCAVAPYEYAKGVTCPSSPPASRRRPPASDPYLGATITTYDADGRVVQTTNPLGGITYTAYDQAGEVFCTVAPAEAAQGVTCPSSPPSTPPTIGDDPYLGATITTYDANGSPVQVTNPLGGITLTAYDAANNVAQTTVESNSSTADPNVVTTYSYDADNRVVSTTVDPGGRRLSGYHGAGLRPRRQRLLLRVGQRRGGGQLPVPAVADELGRGPSEPIDAVLDDAHPGPGQRRHHHLLQRQRRRGAEHRPRRTHLDLRFRRRRAHLLQLGPDQRGRLADRPPVGHLPLPVPVHAAPTAPAQGSNPGYLTTIYDAAGPRWSRPTRSVTPPLTPTPPAARCSPLPTPGAM